MPSCVTKRPTNQIRLLSWTLGMETTCVFLTFLLLARAARCSVCDLINITLQENYLVCL